MSTTTASHRAARQYVQNRRRRLQAMGQWQDPYVDAEPVRAHVMAIRQTGMSEESLTRRLDLPPSALKNLMRGANGRPPGKTVLRETAEAVLGYWPTLNDFPDAARISVTGTLRRVQALETLGFSKPWVAAQIGYLTRNLKACLRSATVSARLARRVAGVYDQYWMDRPEDHGVPQHVANRVRQHAASQGFHGPLTWDDDTIDDPKAEPQMDAAEPVAVEGENLADRWLMGESVILSTTADRDKALIHLFEWTTLTPAQIAERLEMAEAAAEQVWFRHRRKCRAEGRPVPWRRRWELRDKNLTKNDLEEVA